MARPRSAAGGTRSTMVKSKDRATSSVAARRAVLKRLRDEEIEHVLFWFTDLEGHLKSFAITPSEMEDALDDGMGFSLHDTVMETGTETTMWYRNHLEAVYCIEGEGEIEDLATGERHVVTAGTMYALDDHDHHVMRVKQRMRMVCVFNPPCTGREVHDDEGVYPLLVDDPEPNQKTA